MPELVIEHGPITIALRYPSGHDTIFALQHGAEALLRQLLNDYGRLTALGAVPLELYPNEEVKRDDADRSREEGHFDDL